MSWLTNSQIIPILFGRKLREPPDQAPSLPYATEDQPYINEGNWIAHTIVYSPPRSNPYIIENTRNLYTRLISTSSVTDGSYSTISRCVAKRVDDKGRTSDPFYVAVKTLRAIPMTKDAEGRPYVDHNQMKLRLTNEVNVLKNLHHPNIVPILAYHEGIGVYDHMFVTPWYSGGNVEDWVKQRPGYLPKLEVISGIASALSYMHQLSPPLVHGDIRPDNIMIEAPCRPIIIEFGLASMISDGSFNPDEAGDRSRSAGTDLHRWLSDRRVASKPLSTVDDTYAFGCIILYVLTSQVPFHMAKNVDDFWKIRSAKDLPSAPEYFQGAEHTRFPFWDFWWDTMNKCWRQPAPPPSPMPGPRIPVSIDSTAAVSSFRLHENRSVSSQSVQHSLDSGWSLMLDVEQLLAGMALAPSSPQVDTRSGNPAVIFTSSNDPPSGVGSPAGTVMSPSTTTETTSSPSGQGLPSGPSD